MLRKSRTLDGGFPPPTPAERFSGDTAGLIEEIFQRFAEKSRTQKGAWKHQNREWADAIVAMAQQPATEADTVPMTLARAIAAVLQHWAASSLLGLRASRIHAALKEAKASREPLAHFQAFLTAKLDETHVNYITPLLAELQKYAMPIP